MSEFERPPQPEIREDRWALMCLSCGFESYRGLPIKELNLIREGHQIVMQRDIIPHDPVIYEIDFTKPLGYINQSRPTPEQIDAIVDMSG